MTGCLTSVENSDIYLQEKEPGTKPLISSSVVRDYERHWTPIHLDFICDNVDELVSKIVELGGLHEGGDSGDWGSIAYCADPFGHELFYSQVLQHKKFLLFSNLRHQYSLKFLS